MKQDYYRPSTKLREGNVFTGVCHSVHKAGSASSPTGTLPLWDHTSQDHPPPTIPTWTIPHLGLYPLDKAPRTIPLGPHLFPEPYLPWDHTPSMNHKSGCYTFYLNAFLSPHFYHPQTKLRKGNVILSSGG